MEPRLEPMAWSGSLAIANIGLSGEAIMGSRWDRHRAQLRDQFIEMLDFNDGEVCGLCLGEVGSIDHPLTDEVGERVQLVIEEAFENSSAARHGRCQIVWPAGIDPGETLIALRGDMKIELLRELRPFPRQARYRVVERLLLLKDFEDEEGGTAEHAILVYNTHQPSSRTRMFTKNQRVAFCESILEDMARQHNNDSRIVGVMVCGDANCNQLQWAMSIFNETSWRLHFEEPKFLYAREGISPKDGDVTVVVGVKNEQFKAVPYDCYVKNREKQHDVMIAGWCFRKRDAEERHVLRASKRGKTESDGPEPSATSPPPTSLPLSKPAPKPWRRKISALPDLFSASEEEEQEEEGEEVECETGSYVDEDEEEEASQEERDEEASHWRAFEGDSVHTLDYSSSHRRPQDGDDGDSAHSQEDRTGAEEGAEEDRGGDRGHAHTEDESEEQESEEEEDEQTSEEEEVNSEYEAMEEEKRRERAEERKTEDEWDMIVYMAWSALMLPEMSEYRGAAKRLQNMDAPAMFRYLSDDMRRTLRIATENFFMVDIGASEQGGPREKRVKTGNELRTAWQELFRRRRTVEGDDTRAITDEQAKARIHNDWMDEWLANNLEEYQRKKPRYKQTSIWNAYLRSEYGGKHFMMALLETGIVWGPSLNLFQASRVSAAEHVGQSFCIWLQRVLDAIERHKSLEQTQQARRRSGNRKYYHGLTPEEEDQRWALRRAKRDLYLTVLLAKQYKENEETKKQLCCGNCCVFALFYKRAYS